MVTKKDRRKRDIRSKLVAAICMLMVSCIMVVSSTYAWFTLSTAPEVTGITTAIGANGNLEMALLPNGTSVAEALNAIGATGSVTNNTWGNLVDLEDDSYGMENIVLNPATLGTVTNGILPEHFLSAPTYGADGRVSGLNNTMLNKVYSDGAFKMDGFGVRALGTSSGMSAHEMAYRNALVAADTAKDNALSAAKNAISNGGTLLADLAIQKAGGTTEFTATDVQNLITAYGHITTTVDKIEEAIRLYIIADVMADGALTEDTFNDALTAMSAMSLADLIASEYYTKLTEETRNAISTITTALTALENEVDTNVTNLHQLTSYTWSDLSPYVTALADVDNMKLNGHAISDYLDGSADISGLASGERKLVVNTDGTDTSGIFMQVANFVDSFSTPIVFEEISYNHMILTNISVTMVINKSNSVDPAHLETMDELATAYEGTPFNSTTQNIDSFYGFIIDMAFRTNASDSSLLLQTDAVDRIYEDNKANPATMGGGSTMTYEATQASGYTADQLISLMENIRIVLFDPDTLEIFGYARLDSSEAAVDDDGNGNISVTMPIKMWQEAGDWDENGEQTGEELTGRFAVDSEGNEDATITSLVQNTATAVSTLVYLEGATIENADVGNTNITGTMNIQFSSSATLKPMEYGDLRKDTSGSTTTTSYDVNAVVDGGTPIQITSVNEGAAYTVTLNTLNAFKTGGTYDLANYDVSVEMAGADTDHTIAYDETTTTVTVTGGVTGEITITLTAKTTT